MYCVKQTSMQSLHIASTNLTQAGKSVDVWTLHHVDIYRQCFFRGINHNLHNKCLFEDNSDYCIQENLHSTYVQQPKVINRSSLVAYVSLQ